MRRYRKSCILFYIKNCFMGKKVIFTITTNATLLKESIVEFFVEKINGEFKI